jgi:signal peptidase II
MNSFRVFLKIILLFGLDQITKAYFVSRDFFVPNHGLPFGLDFGFFNLAVILAGLIFFLWLFWRSKNKQDKILSWGFVFLFSGAVANLLDRVVLGYVRDFIDLGLGFTFNLADVFVMIGLIIILFQSKDNKV